MESTTSPSSGACSKVKRFLVKIIRFIGCSTAVVFNALLNLLFIVITISYIHGGYTLRGCLDDFFCDVGELVGNKHCLGLGSHYTTTWGKLDYTLQEQWLCHEQHVHMSRRCYLPHFINRQYEKYQAKQRGEAFYGEVKNCRDIKVKKEEKK